MKPLLEAAGVDYAQWLVLTKALLKRDFRTRSINVGRAGSTQTAGMRALVSQAILYSVFGLLISGAIILSKDLFFIGVVMSAYVMFMVGTAVLLDHSSALTASDDYAVLGFRPITSRTYFAVRLTNVLAYTVLMTTLVAYMPVGALFVKHGARAGIAGFFALYGTSLSVAFSLLFSYASLQRLVGPDRLKSVLSYVQLLMSFGIYGGYFLISKLVSKAFLATFTLSKTWWLMLLPPTWFASYFDLANGTVTPMVVLPAAASIALLAGLTAGLTGRLSSGFSERLGESAVAARRSGAPSKPTAAGWWFRAGEARAMALLIRSQFRNDQKFRMGVLTIIPLTVLYIFQGVTEHDAAGREFMLVGFAIMMFPAMLKMQLTHSDAYRASWIFFAAPVNRAALIRAAKNVVVAMFLLPYLLFVMVAMGWATHNPVGASVRVLLLGLISHLVLQITILMDPELPFAKPSDKNRSSSIFVLMVGIGIVNVVLLIFGERIFGKPLLVALTAAAIVVISVFVELITKARVDEQARKLEFLG